MDKEQKQRFIAPFLVALLSIKKLDLASMRLNLSFAENMREGKLPSGYEVYEKVQDIYREHQDALEKDRRALIHHAFKLDHPGPATTYDFVRWERKQQERHRATVKARLSSHG